MSDLVARTQELLSELDLEGGILGHVGDRNIHTVVACPEEARSRASELTGQLVEYAVSVGGTITGEHGVGLAKRPFLTAEHGSAVGWMQRLKELFDPDGTLNPGKIA